MPVRGIWVPGRGQQGPLARPGEAKPERSGVWSRDADQRRRILAFLGHSVKAQGICRNEAQCMCGDAGPSSQASHLFALQMADKGELLRLATQGTVFCEMHNLELQASSGASAGAELLRMLKVHRRDR